MSDTPPLVSVIICTHNRSADVLECLDILQAHRERLPVEILVIDSASSAEHAQILRDRLKDLPVSYLRLDEPGLSKARNAGMKAAKGSWLWYVDDDAVPFPDWPETVRSVVAEASADTAIIGGRVIPRFAAGTTAPQLTPRWLALLSCVDDDAPGFVADGHNIVGANLMVRRDALTEAGGFSEQLGRKGDKLLSGEEVLLIEHFHDRGLSCAYDPRVQVHHKISAERLKVKWAGDRAYWEGYSRYVVMKLLGRGIPAAMNPLKLQVSGVVLQALLLIKPNDPDLTIRKRMAKGTLDAMAAGDVIS
ncbi:MAG TPA: glycosyltransferase [Asticcacaulis sp.]|nr:glycosyltransferase [Asticcacaulis sp.]